VVGNLLSKTAGAPSLSRFLRQGGAFDFSLTQFWLTTVATAGDEVQIVRAIITMQTLGHLSRIATRVRV